MKRLLSIIIASVVLLTSLTFVGATYRNVDDGRYDIDFNGMEISASSVIYNDAQYVPLRKVFEKMGAHIFYRNRDRKILALSRFL